MDNVSGFTFIHNGVEGGYPFVEAIEAVMPYVDEMVVIDAGSTDETRDVLEQLDVRIIDSYWEPGKAGRCLSRLHALNTECEGDIIWHFEADEVFSEELSISVRSAIDDGHHRYGCGISVRRLQVEQNFQRCRWYPEIVHRVFRRGSVEKHGHTTRQHYEGVNVYPLGVQMGLLWDVTNCFRDEWLQRCKNQAELWGDEPRYRFVPVHFTHRLTMDESEIAAFLNEAHWTWEVSPFYLPESLKNLVGVTSYKEYLRCQQLIS